MWDNLTEQQEQELEDKLAEYRVRLSTDNLAEWQDFYIDGQYGNSRQNAPKRQSRIAWCKKCGEVKSDKSGEGHDWLIPDLPTLAPEHTIRVKADNRYPSRQRLAKGKVRVTDMSGNYLRTENLDGTPYTGHNRVRRTKAEIVANAPLKTRRAASDILRDLNKLVQQAPRYNTDKGAERRKLIETGQIEEY